MKKAINIILAILITVCIPQNVLGQSLTKETPTIFEVSLDDAYKMIQSNNMEVKLIDKKIEISKKQYEDSLDIAKQAQSKMSDNQSANLLYRKQEKLNWQFCLLDLESLKNDRNEIVKRLNNGIKQQYLNTQSLKNEHKMTTEELNIIEKKLNEISIRIRNGQAKDIDYKKVLSQKLMLQNQINSTNKQISSILISMKKDLGLSLSSELIFKDISLPYIIVDDSKLDSNINKSVENSYDIKKQEKQLELKKLEKDLIMTYTEYRYSTEYFDIIISISELESQLLYNRISNEADLRIAYLELQSMKDSITLEELNLKIEKLNYDSEQAKSKLGMTDATTESNARIAYNRQQNNLQRAKYNYILAAEQLNEKLGIQQ